MMPLSYRSPKTELRSSAIHGKGIFAKMKISAGEIVWIRTGNVVPQEEVESIDAMLGDFSLQVEKDFFLSPADEDSLNRTAIFFNHSCDPNVGINGHITFIAMREIEIGEELTVDFATIEARKEFFIECNCRSPLCRNRVTGDDWRDAALQQRYVGYFSTFLERQILLIADSNNELQPTRRTLRVFRAPKL